MTALTHLGREHRLFERLLERLRRALELAPAESTDHIVETLGIILPALERHDAIEDLIFGAPGTPAHNEDEKRARELVDAQHGALETLGTEIRDLLKEAEAPTARLRVVAELLAGRLEWHFKTEEVLLWPLLAKEASRSLSSSAERRAAQSVRALEDTVANLEVAMRQKRGGSWS